MHSGALTYLYLAIFLFVCLSTWLVLYRWLVSNVYHSRWMRDSYISAAIENTVPGLAQESKQLAVASCCCWARC